MSYPTVHDLIGRVGARSWVSFTAHMLRHSAATDMVRQGVPVDIVARLLTHRSSTTTSQPYVHLEAADIKEALLRAGSGSNRRPSDEPGFGGHPGPGATPQRSGRPGTDLDGKWASARRGHGTARFDAVTQGWLRAPVKRWSGSARPRERPGPPVATGWRADGRGRWYVVN